MDILGRSEMLGVFIYKVDIKKYYIIIIHDDIGTAVIGFIVFHLDSQNSI